MSSEATIALAVLPAAVAVAGTLGATWMLNKNAVESRKAVERADRRARGGSVLGRIRLLLLDASPEVIAVNINGVGDAAMPDVLHRWRSLRDELAIFAEGDSDAAVREAARELTVAVENGLNRLGGVLYDQKMHTGMGPDMLEAAREHYAEARSLVEKLGPRLVEFVEQVEERAPKRNSRVVVNDTGGRSWAEIARFVGQRKLSITADTYTHVLMDYREVDREKLLERVRWPRRVLTQKRQGRTRAQHPPAR